MWPAMIDEPISPGRGLPVYQPATDVLDGGRAGRRDGRPGWDDSELDNRAGDDGGMSPRRDQADDANDRGDQPGRERRQRPGPAEQPDAGPARPGMPRISIGPWNLRSTDRLEDPESLKDPGRPMGLVSLRGFEGRSSPQGPRSPRGRGGLPGGHDRAVPTGKRPGLASGRLWPHRAWRAALLTRRSRTAPPRVSRPPAATAVIHGSGDGAGPGAVPPSPVLAPPCGMTALPAASCRSAILRPLVPSRTTTVWMVSAASWTFWVTCSDPPVA